MGLYTINCSQCSTAFQWFSGSLDQRCEDCKQTVKYGGYDMRVTPDGVRVKATDLFNRDMIFASEAEAKKFIDYVNDNRHLWIA